MYAESGDDLSNLGLLHGELRWLESEDQGALSYETLYFLWVARKQ